MSANSSSVEFKVKLNSRPFMAELQQTHQELRVLNQKTYENSLKMAKNENDRLKARTKFHKTEQRLGRDQLRIDNDNHRRKKREEADLKKLNAQLKKNNTTIKESEDVSTKFGTSLASVGAAASVALIAVGTLYKGVSALKDIADKADKSQAKLNAIISATGQKGNFNARKIDELSGSISRLSGFTKSQVKESSAMLLSFGLNDRALAKLMPRMADVAAFMGTDMNQAAQQMGKAINTGYGALTRIGITMSDTQKRAFDAAEGMERVNLLAEIMDQNVGGAAAAINSANYGVGNLTNEISALLLPLGRWVKNKIVWWLKNATQGVRNFRTSLEWLGEKLGLTELSKGRAEIEKTQQSLKSINKLISYIRDGGPLLHGHLNSSYFKGIKIKDNEQALNILLRQREGIFKRLNSQSAKTFGDSGAFADGVAKGTEESSTQNTVSATLKKQKRDEFGFIIKSQEEQEAASYALSVQNDQQKAAALLEIQKEKQKRTADLLKAEADLKKRNDDIARSESKFWMDFEIKEQKKKNAKLVKIEEEKAADLKIIRDKETAYQKQQKDDQIALAKGSAGVLMGVGESLAIGLITHQENAAEKAAAAVLTGIGQQLVGFGTQKIFQGAGMLLAPVPDPRGAGLIALGVSAGAAGVAMGAGGAVINASIAGSSVSSNSNVNGAGGASIASRSSIQNSNNSNNGPSQDNVTIITSGPIFGDIRETVNAYSRAKRKTEKFSLRTV